MKLEIKKEIVTPNSTNTDPLLYNLTIKGVGNLQECEFIINRLAEQVSVEPEFMQKFTDKEGNQIKPYDILKVNPEDDDWLDLVIKHKGELIFISELDEDGKIKVDGSCVKLKEVLFGSENPAIIVGNLNGNRLEFSKW